MEEKNEIKRIFIVTLLLGLFSSGFVFYHTGGDFYSSNLFSPVTPEDATGLIVFIELIIVLLLPFIFLVIYFIFGREKDVVVPEYLSTIPNKNRTPYEVNLLFRDPSDESDEYGFYATLLDLHRKGRIQVTRKNSEDVLIRIKDKDGDDEYETRVLRVLFYIKVVRNKVFIDTGDLKKLTREARRESLFINKDAKFLRYSSKRDEVIDIKRMLSLVMYTYIEKVTRKKHLYFLPEFLIPLIVAAILAYFYNYEALCNFLADSNEKTHFFKDLLSLQMLFFVGLMFVAVINLCVGLHPGMKKYNVGYFGLVFLIFPYLMVDNSPTAGIIPACALLLTGAIIMQLIAAFMAPRSVFGHWKNDYYREKLEWEAFRNFLSDFHHLEECDQTDIDRWEEWLIYGTALGVGPQVSRQILNVLFAFENRSCLVPDYNWFATFQNIYDFDDS